MLLGGNKIVVYCENHMNSLSNDFGKNAVSKVIVGCTNYDHCAVKGLLYKVFSSS
jgi:hypothetical protein